MCSYSCCRRIIVSCFKYVSSRPLLPTSSTMEGSHANVRTVAGIKRRSTRLLSASSLHKWRPVGVVSMNGRSPLNRFSLTNLLTASSFSYTEKVPWNDACNNKISQKWNLSDKMSVFMKNFSTNIYDQWTDGISNSTLRALCELYRSRSP